MQVIKKKVTSFFVWLFFPFTLPNVSGGTFTGKLKAFFCREVRTNASPLKLSLSLSCGVLLAIMPIHGCQVVLVLVAAYLLRLNRPAALLGVSVSSAPLLPFWILAGITFGTVFIPPQQVSMLSKMVSLYIPDSIVILLKKLPVPTMLDTMVTWFFGSIILAVVCSLFTFIVSYILIKKYVCFKSKSGKNTLPVLPQDKQRNSR